MAEEAVGISLVSGRGREFRMLQQSWVHSFPSLGGQMQQGWTVSVSKVGTVLVEGLWEGGPGSEDHTGVLRSETPPL